MHQSLGHPLDPSPCALLGLIPLRPELTGLVSVGGLSRGCPAKPLLSPPPAHQAHQDQRQDQYQAEERRGAKEQPGKGQRHLAGPRAHRLLRLQRRPGCRAAGSSCCGRGRGRSRLAGEGKDSGEGGGGQGEGETDRGEGETGRGEGYAVIMGGPRPCPQGPLSPLSPWQSGPLLPAAAGATRPVGPLYLFSAAICVGAYSPRIYGPAGRSTRSGRRAWGPARPCLAGSGALASWCQRCRTSLGE
ncbi:hypothetical protein P7K49_002440 [Saguinus oedipus]|uniref:Uncharacterized protein n=1 Tax=Saguinus oedipus TaxID=9490 RepID=A0ABQ9WHD1_SAGOE|nr:hypothetical protein P7K49_002440 [Saguinus oedipus]